MAKHDIRQSGNGAVLALAWAGSGATALVLMLRVCLTPTLRDADTGRFSAGYGIIAMVLAALLALWLLCLRIPRRRVEVRGSMAIPLALSSLLAGAALGISGVWEAAGWWLFDQAPSPAVAVATPLTNVLVAFTLLCEIAGGVALIALGLRVASEGGTRCGMSTWGVLVPVLWMWLRLVRYEMSYVSAVGASDSFYDFGMFLFELLFLFKLARFASGIADPRPGSLLFFSFGCALFSLTNALTRLCMYLLGDTEAYLASDLPGVADFALGLLALVFALGIVRQMCVSADSPTSSVSEPEVGFPAESEAAELPSSAEESDDFSGENNQE